MILTRKKILMLFFVIGVCTGIGLSIKKDYVSMHTINTVISVCAQEKNNQSLNVYYQCIRIGLKRFITPRNLPQVMAQLDSTVKFSGIDSDINNTSACHEIGHIVGELSSGWGFPVPYLMRACGSSCGYGCSHGVMVGLVRREPSLLTRPDLVCRPTNGFPMTKSDMIACRHGLGHANAEIASYDLGRAIRLCEGFSTDGAQEQCNTGVFMEIFTAPTASHNKAALPQSAHGFCLQLPPDIYTQCIRQIAEKQYVSSKQISDAMSICGTLSDDMIYKCVAAVGASVYFVHSGDPIEINRTCEGVGKYLSACLSGSLTSSLVIDKMGRVGEGICRANQEQITEECLSDLATQKAQMSEEVP